MSHHSYAVWAIVFCLSTIGGSSIAGTITSLETPTGLEVAAYKITYPLYSDDPNNDPSDPDFDPDFSDNFCQYDLSFGATGPLAGVIDLTFDVSDSGGVSEYDFWAKLRNKSPLSWNGMRLVLGTGSGTGFVPIASGTGLDFDWPAPNSSFQAASFSAVDHGETVLTWHSGSVNPPNAEDFFFTIDVPDGLDSFTIRHIALPEPSSLLLCGGIVTAALRRYRRSAD